MSKYGYKPIDWFESLVNKMGGVHQAERFLRGELALSATPPVTWPAWLTVELGKHKSSQDYLRVFKRAGLNLIQHADELVLNMPISSTRTKLSLLLIYPAYLGFEGEVRQDIFFAKAISSGLSLCPAEVAPALILQHRSELRDRIVFVAMEGILTTEKAWMTGKDGSGLKEDYAPLGFRLGHPNGANAIGSYGVNPWRLKPNDGFVFVLPNKKA